MHPHNWLHLVVDVETEDVAAFGQQLLVCCHRSEILFGSRMDRLLVLRIRVDGPRWV